MIDTPTSSASSWAGSCGRFTSGSFERTGTTRAGRAGAWSMSSGKLMFTSAIRLVRRVAPVGSIRSKRNRQLATRTAARAGRELIAEHADFVVDYARSRWGEGADGSPVEMLAGFYARYLLAGLERALGPWDGWTWTRGRLQHAPGPELTPSLWCGYAQLSESVRARVLDLGDRSASPPDCLAPNAAEGGGARE